MVITFNRIRFVDYAEWTDKYVFTFFFVYYTYVLRTPLAEDVQSRLTDSILIKQ
jgi:hypothetical protein